ncbi:MAG: hypothetical protein SFU91_11025 [Chloroherpetonaceae bacterium]|nr:hypothetical protein [Chloroherpetonaceae bacterium]
MRVFLLKSKGKGIVPDYIQVRDERQSIIGYFKAVNFDKGLDEIKIFDKERRVKASEVFKKLEYGKMILAEL